MDKEFRFIENNKKLAGYIKLTIVTLLAVMEVVVIAQYVTTFMQINEVGQLIEVIVCCLSLINI